jgi:hypothetical protein
MLPLRAHCRDRAGRRALPSLRLLIPNRNGASIVSAAKAVAAFWQRVNRFELQNLEAAEIIASEPARYPGALQTWAWLVLERERREARAA